MWSKGKIPPNGFATRNKGSANQQVMNDSTNSKESKIKPLTPHFVHPNSSSFSSRLFNQVSPLKLKFQQMGEHARDWGVRTVRKWAPNGPHAYTVENKLIDFKPDDNSKYIEKIAYEALRHNAAPGGSDTEVEETGTLIDIPILGSVNSVADPVNNAVTNTTQRNHLLHEGKVTRSVIRRDNSLFITTVGKGNGPFPFFNDYLAPYIWNPVDKKLKLDFIKRITEYQRDSEL